MATIPVSVQQFRRPWIEINTEELANIEDRLNRVATRVFERGHSSKALLREGWKISGEILLKHVTQHGHYVPRKTARIFRNPANYAVQPYVRGRQGERQGVKIVAGPWVRRSKAEQFTKYHGAGTYRQAVTRYGSDAERDKFTALRISHLVHWATTGTQPLKPGGARNVYAKYGPHPWVHNAAQSALPGIIKEVGNIYDRIVRQEIFEGRQATLHKSRLGGIVLRGGSSAQSFASAVTRAR